jgi:hypothetical protein
VSPSRLSLRFTEYAQFGNVRFQFFFLSPCGQHLGAMYASLPNQIKLSLASLKQFTLQSSLPGDNFYISRPLFRADFQIQSDNNQLTRAIQF